VPVLSNQIGSYYATRAFRVTQIIERFESNMWGRFAATIKQIICNSERLGPSFCLHLRIVADGTLSSIHSLPWEILERSYARELEISASAGCTVTRCSDAIQYSPTPPDNIRYPPRVLFVSSRPDYDEDISYGVIVQRIWKIASSARNYDPRHFFHFARPGTLKI
jgi:hypothetical protein